MIWWIIALNIAVGAVGGLANAFLEGDIQLPETDEENNVWRPGWVGNVVIGAAAALAFWTLYGGLGDLSIVTNSTDTAASVSWTVADLGGSFVAGVGGSRYLVSVVNGRILEREKDYLQEAKDELAEALLNMAEESEGEES